jgi:prepilin signal peptidase PulO-like enzyme (type II secretory pathway)
MIIPDEISIGGLFVGPALCLASPGILLSTHSFDQDPLLTSGVLKFLGVSNAGQLGRLLESGWRVQTGFASLAVSLIGMAVGAGIVKAAAVFGKSLFHKEAMGKGDVKLMGMIGAFVGWQNVLLAFFLACVYGSVIGIFLMLRRRDTHIPFGPYLAAGAATAMVHRTAVIRLFWDVPAMIRAWL